MIRAANLHTLRKCFSHYGQVTDILHCTKPQTTTAIGPSLTELQVKHQAKATQKQQFSQEYTCTTELIFMQKQKKWLHIKVLTCHLRTADWVFRYFGFVQLHEYLGTPDEHIWILIIVYSTILIISSWILHDQVHQQSLHWHPAGQGSQKGTKSSSSLPLIRLCSHHKCETEHTC